MNYSYRLATLEDAEAIAPLWAEFASERQQIDPSMRVKPNFDFYAYIRHQLAKPLTYAWVLEVEGAIAGCLIIYFYDEAPPPELPETLAVDQDLESPFISRRVGSVLGLYVKPEHRQGDAIASLAKTAIAKAEELNVTDIDLLISADQSGIQALLKRSGFTQAAVQFTKHYQLTPSAELPRLHPPYPELDTPPPPHPDAIPLRDTASGDLIHDEQGDPVFIFPLTDASGELIKTESGLPIYPTPLRDPQTQEFVFDQQGKLVTCPVVRDSTGNIVEYQGIAQFHPPVYQVVNGKLHLQKNESGEFQFCDIEKNEQGELVRSPSGMPLFKKDLVA
ncbi:GNAT family N-acetyltransferase [Roseofilum capinflatum]|uniref:GNAT family N-acetyltransferase n=1 Tax=Roseofilum capinflatum BLCC-M114 TaxID=3022440 RepID=A0ABT7BA45_9CYAN|nr:GNAT family N-acetyltransferase [Roseofilum capinflatum]MDJ1176053.1 GNAT family N-acetyltransferase [Roseofilum capinflatum BLCC-M114]